MSDRRSDFDRWRNDSANENDDPRNEKVCMTDITDTVVVYDAKYNLNTKMRTPNE